MKVTPDDYGRRCQFDHFCNGKTISQYNISIFHFTFPISSLVDILNYLTKDSRDILISVNHTINLYIFITNLIDNHIIFPYGIFIVCPKADSF